MLSIQNKDQITSLELLDQINYFRNREGAKTVLTHANLLKSIRVEFEEEIGEGKIHSTSYTDIQNKKQLMYILTYSQSRLLLGKESRLVRKAVNQHLDKVEKEVIENGYYATDGKQRVTTQEVIIGLQVGFKFQNFNEVKAYLHSIIKRIVKEDATNRPEDKKYISAYSIFLNRINWNEAEERHNYEQRCLKNNIRPKKQISKIEISFTGNPDRVLDFLLECYKIDYPTFDIKKYKPIVMEIVKDYQLYPMTRDESESLFVDSVTRQTIEQSNSLISKPKLYLG